MFRTLIFLALAASLTACSDDGLGGLDCTDIAVTSVELTLEDELGARVPGATVTFSTDGISNEPCEESGGPGVYLCGFEVAGTLLITIQAPGYQITETSVDVGADECHVLTEQVTVTLTPA